MAQASRLWASMTALAAGLACSSTGVNLGDNPGSGGAHQDASDHTGGTENAGSGGAEHPASGGAEHPASGGAEHGSGGTAHPASGGAEHPASGGGGGGAAHPGTGGTPDCSLTGCGEAPVCGQHCSEPCGCCPCGASDYRDVNGSAYQCAGDCYSPATYAEVGLATGAFRFAIVKKDEHRNRCFRLIMGTMSSGPFHVVTSPGLFVESAQVSNDAADCNSVSFAAGAGTTPPLDITGHVLAVRDDKGVCQLDLDATFYLQSDPVVTETLRTSGMTLHDIDCPQP